MHEDFCFLSRDFHHEEEMTILMDRNRGQCGFLQAGPITHDQPRLQSQRSPGVDNLHVRERLTGLAVLMLQLGWVSRQPMQPREKDQTGETTIEINFGNASLH